MSTPLYIYVLQFGLTDIKVVYKEGTYHACHTALLFVSWIKGMVRRRGRELSPASLGPTCHNYSRHLSVEHE